MYLWFQHPDPSCRSNIDFRLRVDRSIASSLLTGKRSNSVEQSVPLREHHGADNFFPSFHCIEWERSSCPTSSVPVAPCIFRQNDVRKPNYRYPGFLPNVRLWIRRLLLQDVYRRYRIFPVFFQRNPPILWPSGVRGRGKTSAPVLPSRLLPY